MLRRSNLLSMFFIVPLMSGVAYAAEPGVSDTEIRIGDVAPMSGPVSFLGRAIAVGSRIAAGEINQAGGINGRKLRVITEDDGYVPSRSFQALTKLIQVDDVFAINGTSGAANLNAMLPLLEDEKIPTIVTSAPSVQAYERPTVFTFGALYEDAYFAQLKFIHENLEPENPVYGLIREQGDFGSQIEKGYQRAIDELGVKDGIRLQFSRGTSNFGAEVGQMQAAGVNVVANGAILAGSANLLSEARKLDLSWQLASGWSEDVPAAVKMSSPAGYDYLVADYVAIGGEALDNFLKMASQHVSEEDVAAINRYTVTSYIGIKLLANAMEQCGQDLTRACTVEKLAQLKEFDTNGLSGPISFDNEQHLSGKAVAIYQLNAKNMSFKMLRDFAEY